MKKLPRLIKTIIVSLVCILSCYAVVWGFSMLEVAYKVKIEHPIVKEVALCAVEDYLETKGYSDVIKITCGMDKMESCLIEVTFTDDPLCYTYRYNYDEQGIEILWITDRTIYSGVPKHLPEYDKVGSKNILHHYGIEDYIHDSSFSKGESYIKTKLFENVAVRAM